MKKRCIIFICAFVCFLFPLQVNASDTTDLLDEFHFEELDILMEEIFPKEKMTFSKTLEALIQGDFTNAFSVIKEMFLDQLFYELENSKGSVVQLIIVIIASTLFSQISGAFKSKNVAETGFLISYMMMLTICLNNFRILAEATTNNVMRIVEFMKLLGPVYFFAITIATGSSSSLTFYHLLLILIFLVELLVLNLLVPIAQLYLLIRILGEFSPDVPLSKFAEFLETIIKWTIKTLTGAVIGINLIQGMLAPAIDSVKRSILTKGGQSIPIIGNLVGGTTEIILGTAVLIKNGIGVVGMIACLGVCIGPIIQIAVSSLMYQFAAAIMQPVSDKRMVNCLSGMATSAKLLLKIVVTTGMIFMLMIAVVSTTTGV